MSEPLPQAPTPRDFPQPQGPVGMLGYAPPSHRPRPGIITTVGVLSIVLGAISVLYHAWQLLSYTMFLTFSSFAGPGVTTTTTTVMPAAPATVQVIPAPGSATQPAPAP